MSMKLRWGKVPGQGYVAYGEKLIPYFIEGSPYGTKKSWQLHVNEARVPLAFSSRLRDLKEKAQKLEDESR